MDKLELGKQRNINYKKWFDRWINSYDLKKQIEIANNQNYTRLNIQVHKREDERDKLMMLDDQFINLLQAELKEFKVYREKEIKGKYLFGNKIGEVECNTVYIDWS